MAALAIVEALEVLKYRQGARISGGTVSIILRRADVEMRWPGELTHEQIAQATDLRGEGWLLNRLGKKRGIDPKTVKLWLMRPGDD